MHIHPNSIKEWKTQSETNSAGPWSILNEQPHATSSVKKRTSEKHFCAADRVLMLLRLIRHMSWKHAIKTTPSIQGLLLQIPHDICAHLKDIDFAMSICRKLTSEWPEAFVYPRKAPGQKRKNFDGHPYEKIIKKSNEPAKILTVPGCGPLPRGKAERE